MLSGSKVLFLDVDGVLNNEAVFKDRRFGVAPIDYMCVQRLQKVVRDTGCAVVLSSSWRSIPNLERKLEASDVFEYYIGDISGGEWLNSRHDDGSTVRLAGGAYAGRGSEIAEWLSRHPEVTQYAIVDDDGDMLPEQMPYFVQTNFDAGMTDEHADRLIAILSAGRAALEGE